MSKFWGGCKNWEEAEAKWDESAKLAKQEKPLKRLKQLPDIPGIVLTEKKHLKWKSFKYLFFQKEGKKILSHILKHPIRYSFFYLRSLCKRKAYIRDGDFFLYNVRTLTEFEENLRDKEALLVLGFSYCQKPFECPSGRFTDQCAHNIESPICRQCDIGKIVHALPEDNVIILMIPTVHYIGEKMFEIVERYKGRKILYMITACEMTLEMFGDFGNMLNISGVGIRLDGRICNTMQAFILSEKGIKPGLTVTREGTNARILRLVRFFRNSSKDR
jgi:hypothetical protein